MNEEEYLSAVNESVIAARGAGSEWNRLFIAALSERNLKLSPASGIRQKDYYVMAPQPYAEGDTQWADSWIIEKSE